MDEYNKLIIGQKTETGYTWVCIRNKSTFNYATNKTLKVRTMFMSLFGKGCTRFDDWLSDNFTSQERLALFEMSDSVMSSINITAPNDMKHLLSYVANSEEDSLDDKGKFTEFGCHAYGRLVLIIYGLYNSGVINLQTMTRAINNLDDLTEDC